jgi:hypothetical protein
MSKKKSEQPPFLEKREWEACIKPSGCGYHIYLTDGWLRYGPDGYGWTRLTLAGARRTAARQLLILQKHNRREELKAAYIAGGPSIRELRKQLRLLTDRLHRYSGVILKSDIDEHARLTKLLGPLA